MNKTIFFIQSSSTRVYFIIFFKHQFKIDYLKLYIFIKKKLTILSNAPSNRPLLDVIKAKVASKWQSQNTKLFQNRLYVYMWIILAHTVCVFLWMDPQLLCFSVDSHIHPYIESLTLLSPTRSSSIRTTWRPRCKGIFIYIFHNYLKLYIFIKKFLTILSNAPLNWPLL